MHDFYQKRCGENENFLFELYEHRGSCILEIDFWVEYRRCNVVFQLMNSVFILNKKTINI